MASHRQPAHPPLAAHTTKQGTTTNPTHCTTTNAQAKKKKKPSARWYMVVTGSLPRSLARPTLQADTCRVDAPLLVSFSSVPQSSLPRPYVRWLPPPYGTHTRASARRLCVCCVIVNKMKTLIIVRGSFFSFLTRTRVVVVVVVLIAVVRCSGWSERCS